MQKPKLTKNVQKSINTHEFYLKTRDKNPFDVMLNVPSPDSANTLVINSSQSTAPSTRPNSNKSNLFQQRDPGIFEDAKSTLDDYKLVLSKEMVARLQVNMLDIQLRDKLFPLWTVSYNPPPSLITTQAKAERLVEERRVLAIQMLKSNRQFYLDMLDEYCAKSESLLDSLSAIYKTPAARQFDIKYALDSATSKANQQRDQKFKELGRIMAAIRQAPEGALWYNISPEFTRPPRAIKASDMYDDDDEPTPSTSQQARSEAPPPRPQNQQVRQNNINFRRPNNNRNRNRGGSNFGNNRSSRPQNRANNNTPRNRSQSNRSRESKRRRDIGRYVANAVARTVQNIVQTDYM